MCLSRRSWSRRGGPGAFFPLELLFLFVFLALVPVVIATFFLLRYLYLTVVELRRPLPPPRSGGGRTALPHRPHPVPELVDGFHVESRDAGEARCPVCGGGFDEEGAPPPRRCEACETLHHEDCWAYVGRCAIYGCRGGDPTAPVRSDEDEDGGPLDLRRCELLMRRVRRWFWLSRVRWWLELGGVLLICAMALQHVALAASPGTAVLPVTPLLQLVGAWLILYVWALVTEARIKILRRDAVDVPAARLPRLFKRMKDSKSRPVLMRIAGFFPWAWGVAILVVLVFTGRPALQGGSLMAALLGTLAAVLLPASARRREREIERLRCRVAGTVRVMRELSTR